MDAKKIITYLVFLALVSFFKQKHPIYLTGLEFTSTDLGGRFCDGVVLP